MANKLTEEEVIDILKELKKEKQVKVYTPFKYFDGLKTPKEVISRFNDILKGSKTSHEDPKAYKYFKTDKDKKTKTSKYTTKFLKKYPNAKSLKEKSEATGVPLEIIKKVYDKGVAAWRTGHRVGAGAEQWGYARVHSFLTLGCTALSADSYLLKEALEDMDKKDKKKLLSQKIDCIPKKLKSPYYKKFNMVKIIKDYKKKN